MSHPELGGQPTEFLQPLPIPQEDPAFQHTKTAYFASLGMQETDAFRMHQKQGLWDRAENKEGVMQRDWGNVSEHCLVEVARVRVLTDMLGLDEAIAKDTSTAAALHDYFKKGEKELMVANGLSPEAYSEAGKQSAEGLRGAILGPDSQPRGFSERVVWLAGSVGHETVPTAELIANKPDKTDEDLAYLTMHAVDDWTMNAKWANAAEVGDDGIVRNDLDRRMDAASANPRYAVLRDHILTGVDGQPYRGGIEGAYDAQRRVGHEVMGALTDAIRERTGGEVNINPVDLPVYVDNVIKQHILARADLTPTP